MADLAAVETSTLVLLSFISLVLCGYLFIICWRFYVANRKRVKWRDEASKVSLNWLDMERKPLIPGNFTARTVQPSPPASDSEDEEDCIDQLSEFEDQPSLGRIIFVLRYSGEREELMVRLIQVEGLPSSPSFCNMDTAYVDVHLEYIGPVEHEAKYANPPKLDLCLQQVYYFIISHDQLFVHSLEFRVNTFDEEYRRTVCGEVTVNLMEELGQNMFTGNEVFLIKEIAPVSKGLYSHDVPELQDIQKESTEEELEDERPGALSPVSSHMSWEPEYLHDDFTDIETVPSSDTTSRSGDSVPWRRFRKRKRRGPYSPYPETFGSVSSMPSAFKFPASQKLSVEPEFQALIEQPNFGRLSKKFSVSDTYIPRYGSLNPPPKDFYHLLPDTPLTANELISETMPANPSPVRRFRWTSLRKKLQRLASDSQPPPNSAPELERSNSWPSLRSSQSSTNSHCLANNKTR